MASSSDVVVRLRAIGQAAFTSAMDEAAHSVTGVGKAADKTGKQTDQATKAGQKSGRTWRTAAKGIATWAGGAAAIYGAQRAIRSAVDSTMELSKSTMAIERATGLDTKQASSWAEITKVRGINTKQFQVGLVKLSKTMEGARGGNKKMAASLAAVGVTQDQIAAGDVGGAITTSADAFAAMTSPAQKAATAQNLFGKSGQALLPLLASGSKGIDEQMALVDKYGATLASTKGAKEMVAQQREMKYATDGLKISLGTALVPVLLTLSTVLLNVTSAVQPLLRNTTALSIAIGAITAAFVAYKISVILATLATAGLSSLWLWIPLAIAAIIIGVVALYTKWGWFHRAVDNTFQWIKTHWPLLLGILTGPFGIAAVLIVKNIGKIKAAARGIAAAFRTAFGAVKSSADAAIHWIADRFRELVDFVKSIPSKLGGLAGKAWSKVTGRQAGGIVRAGETTLVGERGPELLQLPGGSKITPLSSPRLAMAAPSLGGVTTSANFYLDRRLVGTAVARDTSDRKARR